MLNIHNLKHNKEAFTLVEVMLLLVVLSLVFASSVSLITRKHKLKPRRSVHGQYICFRDPESGDLRQVTYSGKSLLKDQSGIDKCTFEAPNNSSYMYIMLVGAGGAGGNANHKTTTSDLYEGPMYIDFLKNLHSGYVDGSNEVNGITDDDVKNDAKWKYEEKDKAGNVIKTVEVPFSVLAFKKILADNHVKMFVYDYAGDGDNSGGMQYNLYSRNDADGDDKGNWYRSSCVPHGASGTVETAKLCLKYLMGSEDSDSALEKLREARADLSENRSKCILRDPLSRNCPYLHKYLDPVVGLDGREPLSCAGRKGEQGALIFTKERDFGTGISYANGRRFRKTSAGATDVIDWTHYDLDDQLIHANTCIVGVKSNGMVTYHDGTFMSYDTAVGSLDRTLYNGGRDFSFVDNKDSDGNVITRFDNGQAIYPYQRVFQTYPYVENLVYKLTSQFGQNVGVTCPAGRGDDKIAGGDGKNGGLPFFDDGNKGIKICVNGDCKYEAYPSFKGGTPYTDSTAGGAGAKGLEIDYSIFNSDDFTFKKNVCSEDTSPTVDTKTRSLNEFYDMGWGGRPYFSCTGRVGFSHYNEAYRDYDNGLLRINPHNTGAWNGLGAKTSSPSGSYTSKKYSYKCPALDNLREQLSDGSSQVGDQRDRAEMNSIGLKISHYIKRYVLHHGESGYAGESKTLFARSFGSAEITMLPGVGGKAKPIVLAASATDDVRTASAGNGQSSVFGIGCHTLDDGELECDYKLVAKGGAGGAGFVEEEPAFTPLGKKEIKDYVKKIRSGSETIAPDKYSSSYENGSYEGESSDFQQIAYLSDFPGTDARDIIKKLGKGGDGGYVHHKCWLQPQYFNYHRGSWLFGSVANYGKFDDPSYTFNDWVKANEYAPKVLPIPNIDGGYAGDEFEGYTAFTEDIIKQIGVCGANDKKPEEQFEETPGTDGNPGAIVIMW